MKNKLTVRRDSGIEVLRIIAILMVICLHIYAYGNFDEVILNYNFDFADCTDFIKLSVRACVYIFIIISGYFMVTSKMDLKKSYTRLLKLYGVIWFYSVVLTLISTFFVPETLPIMNNSDDVASVVLKTIFPITSRRWYFITDYFLMCLLSPFVNIVLQKITRSQYKVLITILSVIFAVWFSLAKVYPFNLWFNYYGYNGLNMGKSVFAFLYIYIIGGYIRLFSKEKQRPNFIYLLLSIVMITANYLLILFLPEKINYIEACILFLNPFVILQTVFLLMFFKNLHFHSRFINAIASCTLGVYIIHQFPYFRENFIWNKLFNFGNYGIKSNFEAVLSLIATMLCIFVFCTLVDYIRSNLFKLIGYIFKPKNKIDK